MKNDKFNLELRIRLNKILYEQKEINLDVFQKMENFLFSKLLELKD